MAIMIGKLKLTKRAHEEFKKLWRAGKFTNWTYGKAFYEHFKLKRIVDQTKLETLITLDGDDARRLIGILFQFT